MMISIVGKPGAGKSYTLTKFTKDFLERGYDVFANFKIDESKFDLKYRKRKKIIIQNFFKKIANIFLKNKYKILPTYQKGRLFYWTELDQFQDITNAIIIMDEAQTYFNAKEWQKMRKQDVIKFQQHRKQGLDIYLCSQNLSRVDKEIRLLTAYVIELRRVGKLFIAKRYIPEEIESKRKESRSTEFYLRKNDISEAYNTNELINTNVWLDERENQIKKFVPMSSFFLNSPHSDNFTIRLDSATSRRESEVSASPSARRRCRVQLT